MKQITALFVGLALLVPAIAGAQSISTFELQELLAQDRQQLIALNGEDAVRAYLLDILFLLLSQNGVVTTGTTAEALYGDPTSGTSNSDDDVEVETLAARDIEEDSAELRGEVEEGDDVEVWFAFSRTDSAPSCFSSSQRESVSGDFDEGDDFEEEVTSLRDDTRYYYRACGEDEDGNVSAGETKRFTTDDENNNDDEPDVDLDDVDDIEDDSAELNGSVDMNDFNNGIVFFLWGEDEDDVEDATDEDEYDDIDEKGDDLQKQRVDSDLDGDDDYTLDIDNLDDDTDYYYTLCVEYEDEDDDETLECASVDDFETKD